MQAPAEGEVDIIELLESTDAVLPELRDDVVREVRTAVVELRAIFHEYRLDPSAYDGIQENSL